MPYDVARALRYGQPVSAFNDARDNAMRNALVQQQADRQMQAQDFQQNRLMQQDQAEHEAALRQQDIEETKQLYAHMESLATASPEDFPILAQRVASDPIVQKHGIELPELNQKEAALAARMLAGRLGMAPPDRFRRVEGPRGSIIKENLRTGDIAQVVGPDNTETPNYGQGRGFRPLTAPEIADAGLPPGTSAQVGPDGKIDVLSKRDNTGVLSQKDATTAKMKLNTVALARQQLQKIREAFNEGRKGINAFGGAQGFLPTQAGKKFDARVNQMRSTLTALTRVPGVGAMSDYETKLDQSKFPSRTAYESVTEDVLNNLDDQLSLIENGYKGLLSGASEQPQQASQPQVVDWGSLK